MGFIGNIINKAKGTLGKNSSPNQLIDERYIRQPAFQGFVSTDSLIDQDGDGIDDRLEPVGHFKPGQNITGIKKNPNPKEYKPFSFKGKFKNYNVSFNAKGEYVPTATYPLLPLNHEKKLMDRNRRMRNKENKFLW